MSVETLLKNLHVSMFVFKRTTKTSQYPGLSIEVVEMELL